MTSARSDSNASGLMQTRIRFRSRLFHYILPCPLVFWLATDGNRRPSSFNFINSYCILRSILIAVGLFVCGVRMDDGDQIRSGSQAKYRHQQRFFRYNWTELDKHGWKNILEPMPTVRLIELDVIILKRRNEVESNNPAKKKERHE